MDQNRKTNEIPNWVKKEETPKVRFPFDDAFQEADDHGEMETIYVQDSDEEDEIKRKLIKCVEQHEEEKANQPKSQSNKMNMNKWFLKEFEDHMGLKVGESDDDGDADDSKSEKSSSESDKTSDSDDSNSDGSPSGWMENIKNVNLFSLDKSSEESKPKLNDEKTSVPIYSGPMPSMPLYDEETSQFTMVPTHKEPEIFQEKIEIEKPNEEKKTDSILDKTSLSPIEEEEYQWDSDCSSNFDLSCEFSSTESDEDTPTDLEYQPEPSKLSYWEEMSSLPVDRGEISQEELLAILKEEEDEKKPEKSLGSLEHRSDSELEDPTKDQAKLRDGSDFYEDSAQFAESRENFSVLVIKEDSVFLEYELAVKQLVKIVRLAPSQHRYEIYLLIYPLMALTYLQMMASDKAQKARMFLVRFQDQLDDSYVSRIMKLRDICRPEEVPNKARKLLAGHEKLKTQMSDEAYRQFLYYMEEWPKGQQEKLAAHFNIQSYSEKEPPQQRFGIGKPVLEPIYYGAPEPLHKKDFTTRPFLQKRRRKKNEPQTHKNLHLPPGDRMFNPNPKRIDLLHRKNDEQYRMRLDRENLPSTYLYTAPHCDEVVLCASFSENISMLALGTVSSSIHIFSLKPSKLVQLKSANWLKVLDTGMAGIDKGMLDPTKKFTRRTLHGHQGHVYGISFNPEDRFLLSCSEDFTVRLWCLLSWSCVVIYPGHLSPVCFVVYAPMGYYFATASDDCTARVWVQDNRKPARILQGHLAELAVCIFHPNRHYLASGSADTTVRIWDVIRGLQVRIFNGHRGRITALTYSICGRYLVSGADDKLIMIWDTANETLIRFLDHHKSSINTMEIALDNNLLVVGGQDCQLTIWDFERVLKDYVNRSKASRKQNQTEIQESSVKDLLISSFPSKGAPFYLIRFSRRNLLLAFCVTPRESKDSVIEMKPKQPKAEKSDDLGEWLDFLDTIKLKACYDLKDEMHLDTEQVEKEKKSQQK
ncbi:transcription initiation factor TFIID subunit 5 isoform X2 [Drosophila takahashii]|uniref:transcription initiation factor TFIID subunit 5 isoform X2 n=1 Tax=Drosophila takahashii TaxID=29030 RepID=UPI001CF8EA0F|nr:transcription initiation factor TFIID subunit 5 [Drosophila takahashii]